MAREHAPSPFETVPWPDQLTARVVSPDGRIHGYAVASDLARHYRFSDVVFLTMTGALPDEAQSRAFDAALTLLTPITVAEAPAHVAVLANLCEANAQAVVGSGAVSLAQQAAYEVEQFLAWRARSDEPRAASDELAHAREVIAASGVAVDPRADTVTRLALSTLVACGVDRPNALVAVWVIARTAAVAAEGFATPPASFRDYPMNLPPFRYEEDE